MPEDLQRFPESATSDIHQPVDGEIHPKQVKRALEELIERGAVRFEGNNRWRRYWAVFGDSWVIKSKRYARTYQINQRFISITDEAAWSMAAPQNPSHSRTHA